MILFSSYDPIKIVLNVLTKLVSLATSPRLVFNKSKIVGNHIIEDISPEIIDAIKNFITFKTIFFISFKEYLFIIL